MKVRRLLDSDLETVLSLWNRNMRYDRLTPELLEEKVWDDKDYSQDLAYVVEHEKQIIGFILGIVRQKEAEKIGYIKMFVIDSRYQRRGIGRRLLKEMERLLCNKGAKTIRIFDSAPNYLVSGLDVRYTKALVFFEQNGYERFGENYNMEVDLDEADFATEEKEKNFRAQRIEFRRAKPDDKEKVESFVKQHWPAWHDELQNCFTNKPISLHLAYSQDQIIAFSAYDCNNKGTGWFGPIGTAPEHRKLGIGGVLLNRCLQDIKNQGRRYATIPWVGPIAFYVHYAGAEINRVFYRYRKVCK